MAKHCDFTLYKFRKNLPVAFSQVTQKTCQRLIHKAVVEEEKYWKEDRELDAYQELDIS